MRTRGSVRPLFGLALLAGVAVAGYVAYQYVQPYLEGKTGSEMHRIISGQRILEVVVDATIVPPAPATGTPGSLTATADLTFAILQGERSELLFLLNPGLTVTDAQLNGESIRFSRDGEIVLLKSLTPLPEGAPVSVHVTYTGSPSEDTLLPAVIAPDRVVLPHLSFWHPADLTSFFPMRCMVEIPQAWIPAINGANVAQEGSSKRVSWEEARPVLGATFIAGPYRQIARTHGAVHCNLFWDESTPVDTAKLLNAIGDAYSYLRVLFDSDGFDHVSVVADPNIVTPFNGGNSIVGFPVDSIQSSREQFALLARHLAYNWWGNTVTGRWFPQQPEASSWLVHGFAEYSAWLALQGVKGKTDYLRYVESLRCPPSIGFPMKTIVLRDAYRDPSPGTESDSSILFVRQAYTLSVFAAEVGEDQFLNACKNLLRIHRYRAISYAAALQELELASEGNLRETFRVWFEREGTFDYAVEDVLQDGAAVRVQISNPGDIPAFGELQLALVTSQGTTLHPVEPGANGGSFLVSTNAPIESVILDPLFAFPDMLRANNVWPRRVVPRNVVASPDGRLLVTGSSNPMSDGADQLALLTSDRQSADRLDLPSPLRSEPVFSPDGHRVLVKADAVYSWEHGANKILSIADERFIPVGWERDRVLLQREKTRRWYWWVPGASPNPVGVGADLAKAGSLVSRPGSNTAFFVASAQNAIHRLTFDSFADEPVAAPIPASKLSWNERGDALIYVSRAGEIVQVAPRSGTHRVLVELGYPVGFAQVSPNGAAAAWRDPGNRLRYCQTAIPETRQAQIGGELVSYTWIDETTLIVLVAEPLSPIPALAHARYSLWRIAVDRQTTERLPIAIGQLF
jgi:hypothetical protein